MKSLTERMELRMDPETKARLHGRAARFGMNPSAFLRRLIDKGKLKGEEDGPRQDSRKNQSQD